MNTNFIYIVKKKKEINILELIWFCPNENGYGYEIQKKVNEWFSSRLCSWPIHTNRQPFNLIAAYFFFFLWNQIPDENKKRQNLRNNSLKNTSTDRYRFPSQSVSFVLLLVSYTLYILSSLALAGVSFGIN